MASLAALSLSASASSILSHLVIWNSCVVQKTLFSATILYWDCPKNYINTPVYVKLQKKATHWPFLQLQLPSHLYGLDNEWQREHVSLASYQYEVLSKVFSEPRVQVLLNKAEMDQKVRFGDGICRLFPCSTLLRPNGTFRIVMVSKQGSSSFGNSPCSYLWAPLVCDALHAIVL